MGTREQSTPCPRCGGSGTCRECGGSGSQPCLACEGKGKRTTPRGLSYTCKTCGGSGLVECPTACMSCGGSGEIRESLQREVREKYTPRFADYTPMAGVSTALILINIAVYILTHATPEGRRALVYLVNDPQVMQTGEYWRFFTPMFLHANLMHLGFNCVFLLQFCPALEGVYGPRAFLGLYLFSGLLGDVVSWYGHDGWAGIGASGALFGVGTAYIGLHRRFGLFASHEINGWALYLGAFLLLGFGADALGSNALRIDNWGHLGGAIGGLAFTMLMPRPKGRE